MNEIINMDLKNMVMDSLNYITVLASVGSLVGTTIVRILKECNTSMISRVFKTGNEKTNDKAYKIIINFFLFLAAILLTGFLLSSLRNNNAETINKENNVNYENTEVEEAENEEYFQEGQTQAEKSNIDSESTEEGPKQEDDTYIMSICIFIAIECGFIILSHIACAAYVLIYYIPKYEKRGPLEKKEAVSLCFEIVLVGLGTFGLINLILTTILFPIAYGLNLFVEFVLAFAGFLFAYELTSIFFSTEKMPSKAKTLVDDTTYYLYERVEEYMIAGTNKYQTECEEYRLIPFSKINDSIVLVGWFEKEGKEMNHAQRDKENENSNNIADCIDTIDTEKKKEPHNDNVDEKEIEEQIEWKRIGFNKVKVHRERKIIMKDKIDKKK